MCVCARRVKGNLRGGSLWILTFKADLGEPVGLIILCLQDVET